MTTNMPRIRLAPAAGWTAADLPSEPGTVFQYVNVQNSRNIVTLDADGTGSVMRINAVLNCRTFVVPAVARLLADMEGTTHYEVIGLP